MDGQGGTEVDRLFRHVIGLKHTSTLGYIGLIVTVSGLNGLALSQLLRHRIGVTVLYNMNPTGV